MGRRSCRAQVTILCEYGMQKQDPTSLVHCWATQNGSHRSLSPPMGRRSCRVHVTRHCEYGMQKQDLTSSVHYWATQDRWRRLSSPLMERRSCPVPLTRRFFGTLNLHPSFLLHLQTL